MHQLTEIHRWSSTACKCSPAVPLDLSRNPSLRADRGKEGIIGSKENQESAVSKAIALRRMAFAEEQANVLSFLLSDESSYMHGSIVVNDGGFHDIR